MLVRGISSIATAIAIAIAIVQAPLLIAYWAHWPLVSGRSSLATDL